jgi:hypothetical protein
MPIILTWHRVADQVLYWVRLALLTLFGPAQLDDEHDPIVALRRDHDRNRRRSRHPEPVPRGGLR